MRPAGLDQQISTLAPIEDEAWVVGGSLRDALLGRPAGADLDIAVAGDAEAAARALCAAHPRANRFPLSRAFGAWRVQGPELPFQIDITPLQGGSLAEDLSRRDLTVNALALPVVRERPVVDLHGGLADLAARRLRHTRPP